MDSNNWDHATNANCPLSQSRHSCQLVSRDSRRKASGPRLTNRNGRPSASSMRSLQFLVSFCGARSQSRCARAYRFGVWRGVVRATGSSRSEDIIRRGGGRDSMPPLEPNGAYPTRGRFPQSSGAKAPSTTKHRSSESAVHTSLCRHVWRCTSADMVVNIRKRSS